MAENARWYQSPRNPWEVVDEDGNTVAEVFGEDNELNERVRLFAAAPAMLEALKLAEWAVLEPMGDTFLRLCPVCRGRMSDGHWTFCKLAAAIREGGGEAHDSAQ